MKETKRKAFNFFRSYYDVYNELNDKDKVMFMDALLDRQFLGIKPDKLKGMSKFAYISQTNSIDSQVKGYEDKTGVVLFDSSNSEGGAVGGEQGASVPPSVQVQEKGEEKGEEEEKQKNAIAFSFTKELISLGVEEQIVKDWLKVRRKKKATDSITSLNAIKKQIEVSGKSANECIKICVEKDWKGFSAEWLKEKSSFKSNEKYPISLKTPKFNEIEDEM